MKRRLFLFVLFISVFCPVIKGQLKHSLSYNTIGYYEFFNSEQDRVLLTIAPSYKIEYHRSGLEVFYNRRGIAYHFGANSGPEHEPPGSIRQVVASNIGLVFHYSCFNTPYLRISVNAGLIRCSYNATIVMGWNIFTHWREPIMDRNLEKKIGGVAGLNINVPIYKGIYLNTNTRYSVFNSQFNKQNMIIDLGLGYMYQNKKKQRL